MSNASFDGALQKTSPTTINGRWYRTVKYKRRRQVSSTKGSSIVEGRYHTTDKDSVLYLSDYPSLSMDESTQAFKTVPIKDSAWYTATFNVELSQVLDLTDPKILGRLGIMPTDLVQPKPMGYRLPQQLAEKARASGFEAILAPSARFGTSGKNLVVFVEVVANTGGTVDLAS
ncbi:MAG TPA: RES family NAD+ phosphorylase [Myxococcota bacterium]|nr:RES family NAD+ phosphorylase [Myxococcota bacterium]